MVGTAGFEPTTTCTPSKCATRLRYVPIWAFDANCIVPRTEMVFNAAPTPLP